MPQSIQQWGMDWEKSVLVQVFYAALSTEEFHSHDKSSTFPVNLQSSICLFIASRQPLYLKVHKIKWNITKIFAIMSNIHLMGNRTIENFKMRHPY